MNVVEVTFDVLSVKEAWVTPAGMVIVAGVSIAAGAVSK